MNKNYKLRANLVKLLSLVLLLVIIVISCFPFVLMFFGSFKEDYEIFTLTPKLLPQNGFTWISTASFLPAGPLTRR